MAERKPVIVLSPAKRDMKKGYAWYEDQRPGLGDVFLGRVEQCLDAIANSPYAFQPVAKGARRAVVKQLPYVVFYKTESDAVYVYSVFHTAQNPQKWMDRLGD